MKKGKIIIHFDGVDEQDAPGNRPNLRALCQRCHNRQDAKYRLANRRRNYDKKIAHLFFE